MLKTGFNLKCAYLILIWLICFFPCSCSDWSDSVSQAYKETDDDNDSYSGDDTYYDDDTGESGCTEGVPTKPACTDTITIGDLEWTLCDNGVDINYYCAQLYVTNLELDGKSDWRLPTMAELWTLFSLQNPQTMACDTWYSVNIIQPFDLSCQYVWSDKSITDSVWVFDYVWGGETTTTPDNQTSMRTLAVRSIGGDDDSDDDTEDDDDAYIDCPEGFPNKPACLDTVQIDNKLWTMCDTGEDISQYCADYYAENLDLDGYTDWRLPTMAELWTLFDADNPQPVLCDSYYTANIISPFNLTCMNIWSSKVEGMNAWYLYFYYGDEYDTPRDSSDNMRALAVRDLGNNGITYDYGYSDCPEGVPSRPICTETTQIGSLEWTLCDTGEDISQYCAVHYAQDLRLGGHINWRLPTMAEIWTLFDSGNQQAVLCDSYYTAGIVTPFDLTCMNVWSSKIEGLNAWYLYLYYGDEYNTARDNGDTLRALAVRDLDDNGITYDYAYSDCPEGVPSRPICSETTQIGSLEWTLCDTGEDISHYCAIHYASDLNLDGHTDWRLPTMAELWTLFNAGNQQAVLCDSYYTAGIVTPFELTCMNVWSSKVEGMNAWYLYFYYGDEYSTARDNGDNLRALAVRDVSRL